MRSQPWASRIRRVTVMSAIVFTVLLAGTGGAWAFFRAIGNGSGAARTGTLGAPTNIAEGPLSGSTVPVSWTASSTAGAGIAPQGYYVTRTNTSTKVTSPACGSSASVLLSTTTCTDGSGTPASNTAVPSGTYSYTVTAVYNSWAASAPTPSVAISSPTTSTIYNSTNDVWQTTWGGSITGTASDASSVQSVTYTLQAPGGGYWNGSNFTGTSALQSPTGTTSWSVSSFPVSNFASTGGGPGAYTLTVKSMNGAGNTAIASSSFYIDFNMSNTVFVSPSGADTNSGLTPALPKLTIASALTAAASHSRSVIAVAAVAAGTTYSEGNLTIGSSDNGVSIEGGWDAITWFRSASSTDKATIAGNPVGVTVSGASNITLQQLTVHGANTSDAAGTSVYGVLAQTSTNLQLQGDTISADGGVAGSTGNAGSAGSALGSSGNGQNGSGSSAGTGGNNGLVGGGNGGAGVKKGAGSTGSNGSSVANGGTAGSGATSAAQGSNGNNGSAGGIGSTGSAGTSASYGTGAGNYGSVYSYAGSSATSGGTGTNGGGGGGGGGAGTSNSSSTGGGGGGGGAGGNGGSGGSAGSPGGGSFAVYAYNSSIVVSSSSILTAGNGGSGGVGGAGGAGASGGSGGTGGTSGSLTGGSGGSGGTGGSGGQGGGGAGAPSIGVVIKGTSTFTGSPTINVGSPGNNGSPGTGAAVAQSSFTVS